VQTIRLRKVEVDQSNLDVSLSGRIQVLENRLLQVEVKLGGVSLTSRQEPTECSIPRLT